jgi:hypothetical protein
MKKIIIYTFITALAISAFACKSNTIIDPTAELRLKEQNYSLSGTTTGEYTAIRFLVFKPFFWNKGYSYKPGYYYYSGGGGMFPLIGGATVIDIAKEAALYDALGKLKNADMVTAPRYNVDHMDFLIFEKATVTVQCRGVELSK